MANPNTLSSHQVPLPQCEKLVLFDVDGTLVDGNYNITDDKIFESVKIAKEEGWTLGLSSDTPHESLLGWGEYFGIDGPIIAERGALVDVHGEKISTTNSSHDFVQMRQQIIEHFQEQDVVVWQGNPVSLLKSDSTVGQPGELVILINELREESLGLFFRVVGEEGELTIHEETTEKLVAQIRSFYPKDITFDEDLNHSQGLIIVSHENINKRKGSLELQKILSIGKFAIIGNSLVDYVGDDIAVHLSVADGTQEYKEVADYVANSPVTAGAAEALDALVLSKKYS